MPEIDFPSHSGRNKPLSHAQQRLVAENQGLAIRVAQSLNIRPLNQNSEGRAEAMLGLVIAAQTYDPGKGASFSTWCWHKVRSHLLDWLRREGRQAARYDVQDEPHAVCGAPSPELEAAEADLERRVLEAYQDAPAMVRDVAVMVRRGLSNREMAARLQCSESTIEDRRRQAKAILVVTAMISASPGPEGSN